MSPNLNVLIKTLTWLVAALAVVLVVMFGLKSANAADVYSRTSAKDTLVQSAPAAESWSGFYVGGAVGHGHTVFSDDDGQGGLDLSGMFGGIRAGADLQSGALVYGIWTEYNLSGEEFKLGNTTLIEQTDDWCVNGRLGLAQGRTLAYGFGGYCQVYFEAGDLERDASAWQLGAGIEHKLTPSVSIGMEYAHRWLDADKLLGKGAEDIVDVNSDRVMGVLRYHFGAETVRGLAN